MSDKTGIEWTDATFNPWWGCTAISPGCDHCYAEHLARRFSVEWGPGKPRRYFGDAHWSQLKRWQARCAKTGTTMRVFVASMADVFDNEADPAVRARLWQAIRDCPNLTFQVLTKRIGNAAAMLPADWGDGYPNVWLGATVVNQTEVDRDVPKLLAVPARVRFLSCEPLLGPIDLMCTDYLTAVARPGWQGEKRYPFSGIASEHRTKLLHMLDWVVVGGESGRSARPMHPDWAGSLRDQCYAAGVPFFFKQWGDWQIASVQNGHHDSDMTRNNAHWIFPDGRVQKPSSIRENWFGGEPYAMVRVGKKAAGRLLDGVEHNAYPRGNA